MQALLYLIGSILGFFTLLTIGIVLFNKID